ncbi:MAG: cation diffusion facilitator family transporter, partial [Nitrospinaceae bacterium]
HSAAMISDAVHSFSDLLTDVVALITFKIGQIPSDQNHPYGHGRAETIGAGIIGIVVFVAGAGMAVESLDLLSLALHWDWNLSPWEHSLIGPGTLPTGLAAGCAVFSILVNEALFHYTNRVGVRENSPTLIANAWHHRSDAISSIAALIGISAAMTGYPAMDPAAGLVVAGMILKISWDIFSGALRDLMDTSVEDEKLTRFQEIIAGTPGILQFHDLRSRRIGGQVLLDVHIRVDREHTVTAGHQIAEDVRRRLLHRFKDLQDVLVHVDTEDDQGYSRLYSTNSEELDRMTAAVTAEWDGVLTRTRLRTHYHEGRVVLEVFVRLEKEEPSASMKQILKTLKTRLQTLEPVDEVRVYLDPFLD